MIRSWKISLVLRPDTRNFEVLLKLAAVQLRASMQRCHFGKTPRNLDAGLRNSPGFPLKHAGNDGWERDG